MARRLPSLRGMQAFEAAARHLSFTRAAQELHVTHAAISHQIRALEAELGTALFVRQARGVALTAVGRHLQPTLQQAFQHMAEAAAEVRGPAGPRPLTVSLSPAIAAKWVMPRLHRFRVAHPDIALALLPDSRIVDLHAEEIDVALRYSEGPWVGLQAEPFLTMRISPVCSPRLLAARPLVSPQDLCCHTLICTAGDQDWARWLAAAGAADIDAEAGLQFSDSSLTIPAALDGLGVAMGYTGYVEADLATGLLVQPFGLSLPARCRYHVVFAEERANDPRVLAFRDWVLAEAQRPAVV